MAAKLLRQLEATAQPKADALLLSEYRVGWAGDDPLVYSSLLVFELGERDEEVLLCLWSDTDARIYNLGLEDPLELGIPSSAAEEDDDLSLDLLVVLDSVLDEIVEDELVDLPVGQQRSWED
uniref:Uncharacterized protein n=1 Tax=Strombidium inclinatum TaxID=197538 RepID=A0A7S3ILC1_9SPIT